MDALTMVVVLLRYFLVLQCLLFSRDGIFTRAIVPPDPPRIIEIAEEDVVKYDRFYTKEYHIRTRRQTDSAQKALNYSICDQVTTIPEDIQKDYSLDPFYGKYTHAHGIPILSSDQVSDAALTRACYTVRFLIADRSDIRDALYSGRARVSVAGKNELTNDIPEYSYLSDLWNDRARGLGGTPGNPVTMIGEENLVCDRLSDRWYEEDIMLHEFVHAVHLIAINSLDETFVDTLTDAYNQALNAGKWANHYAKTNINEYLAEGAQSFFDVNTHRDYVDDIHNNISTRTALYDYDQGLYGILQGIFPCENVILDRCQDQSLIDGWPIKFDCSETATPTSAPIPTSMPTTITSTTLLTTTIPLTTESAPSSTPYSSSPATASPIKTMTQSTTPYTPSTSMATSSSTSSSTPIESISTTVSFGTSEALTTSTQFTNLQNTSTTPESTSVTRSLNETTENSTSHSTSPSSSEIASPPMTNVSVSLTSRSSSTSSSFSTTAATVPNVMTSTEGGGQSPTPEVCADEFSQCMEFLSEEDCSFNPLLSSICGKTCRSCEGCHDFHRLCHDLAARGFCDVKAAFMTSHCPMSCSKC